MKRTFFSALVGDIFFAQNRGDLEPEPAPTKPLPEEANAASAYSPLLRRVSALLILSIVNMACLPLAHALEYQRNQVAVATPGAGERYSAFLSRLKTQLAPDDSTSSSRLVSQKRQVSTDIESLDRLRQELEAEWAQLKTQWREADVASSVFAEQEQLEASFYEQHQALRDRLLAANTEQGVAELQRFTEENVAEPTHLPIDLDNLPWQVEQGQARAPLTDAPALEQLLKDVDSQKSARVNSVGTPAADAQKSVAKSAGPVDLAQTLDAPHTDAIKALAAQLGNNPHKIYQWVHDNIYFFPSYGSVQGAQDTLDKRSGNAFDQASLLIALLRSAGIPARYVYGTVDIPAEQVMNWVGGVKNAEAAQQLLGQGGIPNIGLTTGGKISVVRMEHVWVEAFVQYQPHRGAKHVGGQSRGDAWVAMDGSFKQYSFSTGMNLDNAVPFDLNALDQAARTGAVANEAEGWVQHLNTEAIAQQFIDQQMRQQNYIERQNQGQSSVADVLGHHQATIDPLPYLAGSLPYRVQATANRFDVIPDRLRHQFRYEIYDSESSLRMYGSPVLSFRAPTASLAGKKITLAWVAATTADQQAIESLLPASGAISSLPKGLPSSIRLKPQLMVDGELKAEGPGFSAGAEPVGAGAFSQYSNLSAWDETTDQLIAGQQSAIGLSIQGVSAAQLDALTSRMLATKRVMEQAQNSPESVRASILQDITGDLLTGDMLTSSIWSYLLHVQNQGQLVSNQAKMIDLPAMSYGLVHSVAEPRKLYGLVTTGVTFKGLNLDVGHLRYIRWSKENQREAWISYNRLLGAGASALEHRTLEQLWVDRASCRYSTSLGEVVNPTKPACVEGMSAIKALAVASAQGQKIFTLTAQNANVALAQLKLSSSVGSEVRAALAAGKEVTIHEKAISANGWSGYGYMLIDPETGAGAYLIEGKGNGGYLDWWASNGTYVGLALALVSLIAALATVSAVIVVVLFLLSVFVALMNMMVLELQAVENGCPTMGTLGVSLEMAALIISFFGAAGVALGTWISFLGGGAIGGSVSACKNL